MIKTVLFDLDGTLLPMDQERFIKDYFSRLAKHLAPRGYEPQKLVDSIWKGTAAMIKNDGSCTNETAFWHSFCSIYGKDAEKDMPYFEVFYHTEFPKVKASCGYDPRAAKAVECLKNKGLKIVLATNPIFPGIATEHRMTWAGLNKDDFALYTTYENSTHCKPNLDYYSDILCAIGAKPEECLMVGNDVREDMIAAKLGMQVFLLTDCLLNAEGADLSQYPQGGFDELLALLENL